MRTNPQVDAYIAKAAPFAQPVLEHVRKLVHRAVPDVEETIKWSMPFFTLNGKILGNMAAFKEHCSFGLWSREAAALVRKESAKPDEASMGRLFGKMKSVKDLPTDKELLRYIATAAASVQAGKNIMQNRKKKPKPEIAMHPEFAAALKKSKKAAKVFEEFSPSCQREYLEWIGEAKRDETRASRIATAMEWIGEGKKRNWKYESPARTANRSLREQKRK